MDNALLNIVLAIRGDINKFNKPPYTVEYLNNKLEGFVDLLGLQLT